MTEPIRLGDRISAVLARDERMLDVLVAASPAFGRLRNPLLRKTMAKLATVEHAARIAGIDPGELLGLLNGVLAGEPLRREPPRHLDVPAPARDLPAALASVPEDRVVDCDVREDLRAGREPFRRILAAAGSVGEGELLRVRAIFEPAPLYEVLARQGFEHFTELLAEDDYRVWFWRGRREARAAASRESAPAEEGDEGDDVIVIDVRDLEPPEPMVRTLAALERLPPGKTLLHVNVRVPQFLLPRLAGLGFAYEVHESPDLVRIFIRHASR